tara:strand:- start:730 stop:834 length:105 start_codon:yes stop_codon:yes gene_type:complete
MVEILFVLIKIELNGVFQNSELPAVASAGNSSIG